jgi:hypothetical protein
MTLKPNTLVGYYKKTKSGKLHIVLAVEEGYRPTPLCGALIGDNSPAQDRVALKDITCKSCKKSVYIN